MSIRVTNALGEFEYNAIPSEVGDPVEANPETTGDEEDLTSIKIDDTTYKVGEGSDARTYGTFPDTWRTSGTIVQFCSDVNADSTAIEGKAYLGELTCSDLPFNGNADTKVEILSGQGTSGKAIHVVITSGDISPYRWEYTYWNNGSDISGWISFSKVDANPTLAGTEADLTSIEVDGTKYKIPDGSIVVFANSEDIISNDDYLLIKNNCTVKPCFIFDKSNKLFKFSHLSGTASTPDLILDPYTYDDRFGVSFYFYYVDGSTKRLRFGTVSVKEVTADASGVVPSGYIERIKIGGSAYIIKDGELRSDYDWLVNSVQTLAAQSGHSLALALNASDEVEQLTAEDLNNNSVPIIYEDVTT